jgi:deazaflavin-dependent oxidoreductase (nitroreductase family)
MADVPAPVIALGNALLEGTHRTLLLMSGGRFPHRIAGMQTLELHTIGRKTGQRRATLLSSPIHDDQRVILVASKGGYPEDPIWYKNLVANPDVEITIEGTTRRMRARTASKEEKAELWPDIVRVNKGYDGYQQRTARDIPVVICEAVEADGDRPTV